MFHELVLVFSISDSGISFRGATSFILFHIMIVLGKAQRERESMMLSLRFHYLPVPGEVGRLRLCL